MSTFADSFIIIVVPSLQGFEGVHTCYLHESLYTIVQRLITTKVYVRPCGVACGLPVHHTEIVT